MRPHAFVWRWRDHLRKFGLGAVVGFIVLCLILLISNRPFPSSSSTLSKSAPASSALSSNNVLNEVNNLKVLVGMTVGEKCLKRVKELIADWGTKQFAYMFFLYDESDWSDVEKIDGVSIFRGKGLKMYHYKKHVTPDKVKGFDYFFLVDCDCGMDTFDVSQFLQVIHTQEIPIAQPSVAWGDLFDRSSDHRVCRNVEGIHNGRWTTFVECGPFVAFTREAWTCVYDLVQGDLGSGWGMDYKWCSYARDVCRLRPAINGPFHTHNDGGRVCAVIDATVIDHLDEKTAVGNFGNHYVPVVDVWEFEKRFPDVESVVNTNCVCACDCGGSSLRSKYNTLIRMLNVIAPWNFLQCECRF
eukprot:m.13095 g.13095  ORF g.13095 m.13095 type:complete len:356 (+) comp4108_c0_seq1:55-1122(+)